MGDISLDCSGTPNAAVNMNLGVFLSVGITNHLLPGNVVDAVLAVNTNGTAVSAGATPLLVTPNLVSFAGISFTLPASGKAQLLISNLRGAAAQQGVGAGTPIQAFLSSDIVLLSNPSLAVAFPVVGLRAGSVSTFVNCQGSPVPAVLSVPTLFAGSARSMTRVTEGFGTAFLPRQLREDNGTRILLGFSDFPAGARLFVPDAIAGSDAAQPTGSGLLRLPATGGVYTPGSGTLLLARVLGTDPQGAGGRLAFTPSGTGPIALNGAGEVALTDGAGIAVYEVLDASLEIESAEIPTWLGLPATGGGSVSADARETVSFGPISALAAASATAPIPRFLNVPPPPDCEVFGDCAAFPNLHVKAPPLEFTGAADSIHPQAAWVYVSNSGGSFLGWAPRVSYTVGSNWVTLVVNLNQDGSGAANVKVWPKGLNPGVYEATLTIDAAGAGLENFPIKLTVTPPAGSTGDPSAPQVNALVHAATFQPGPVVPGSLASLWGLRLKGASVDVTFDAVSARLLYFSDDQINLEVPPLLAGHSTTVVVVTVDGRSSPPVTVPLLPASPGVFQYGIRNQDNTVNSPVNPAAGGSIIQLWATGVPSADIALITAKIHDQWVNPQYAGPAPSLIGVQQVNLPLPAGWPPMETSVVLCATLNSTGERVCSPESPLSVK
jgi:uncharacterized protein (TIGR03437 family)